MERSNNTSVLRLKIKAYLRDSDKTGKLQKQNIDWLAGKIGIGKSTLHDRLNFPKKFKSTELEIIAEELKVDVSTIVRWGNELLDERPTEQIKSSSGEIEQIRQKEKSLDSQFELKKKLWSIERSIILLLSFCCLVLISLVLSDKEKMDKPIAKPQSLYSATYNGTGTDITTQTMTSFLSFHDKNYTYKFEALQTVIVGEDIKIEGIMYWSHVDTPEIIKQGKFTAKGLHMDGNSAISYKVSETPDNKVWVGSAMLRMPKGGTAKGFWMTIHGDNLTDSLDQFAMGTIELPR